MKGYLPSLILSTSIISECNMTFSKQPKQPKEESVGEINFWSSNNLICVKNGIFIHRIK